MKDPERPGSDRRADIPSQIDSTGDLKNRGRNVVIDLTAEGTLD